LTRPRIYLSPPHQTGLETALLNEALQSNWIAPAGPQLELFEHEFRELIGAGGALAVSSGTAALHLALLGVGVGPGDQVLVSTLTFAASVNPIRYCAAEPIFVDSEPASWNMDPRLLAQALRDRTATGRRPRAVVVVHLYGQSADLAPILEACQQYDVPLIEDAAEALGATYHGRSPGTFGRAGFFSFNGNKIITTSGGGMLVSQDEALLAHARKLATQAREPAPHYEHREIGYNYRLSNLLAALGRAQLPFLEERVQARRSIYAYYAERMADLPGIRFMPDAPWGRHTRWLTCLTIDPVRFGCDREKVRMALEKENIEARPVWKPMHLQPAYAGCERLGGEVAEVLFAHGLCLPSGSALTRDEQDKVIRVIRNCCRA